MTIEPKTYTLPAIAEAAGEWRQAGLQIVFTNGCFDIIHPGHTRYLREARQLGDVLVVGLNADESVRQLKGPGRPVMNEGERGEVLLSLRWVDAVVIFSDPTPLALIEAVVPHFLVKGGDWPVESIVGADFVRRHGGEVVSLPFHTGLSTTELIHRITETDP
ncbi:MAG: D-glycero-beta-D-manno-heptose 1-phosphate adenylyltransferase [bacterium]|nr:MAG: D-glycero-beta-D-manno-heptose 1-phosphate adenylyltransferase [bacterium]